MDIFAGRRTITRVVYGPLRNTRVLKSLPATQS
jgi:hypothetical protein